MRSWIRNIASVAVGVVLAFVIVAAAEAVNSRFYSPPPGVDFRNTNSLRDFVANLPSSAFILVLLGWAVGTFCGAWLASRLTGRALPGAIVGGLVLVAGFLNLLSLPHPGWVWASWSS